MAKDQLKAFNIEVKIDYNINKVIKVINTAYYYLDDAFLLMEKDELLEQLEEAEDRLKKSQDLIDILAEIYENLENKNS